MPAMSSAVTSSPAISRSSTQSKPFSLGLRAQPGAPITGFPPSLSKNQQIAGIDRHAGTQHLAAGLPDGGRNDVVEIAERRRAEDDDHVALRRQGG